MKISENIKKTITGILVLIIFLYSCNSVNDQTVIDKTNSLIDTVFVKNESTNFIEKNFTDTSGLKQGTWISYDNNGYINKIANYTNDSLNGIVIEYRWMDKRMWEETSYIKGKKDGYSSMFSLNESPEAKFLTYYKNDSTIWLMFPSTDINFFGPQGQFVKGITINVDSFHVKAPFKNGALWYEGTFVKVETEKQSRQEKAIGTHKRYFENGKLRMITNYSLSVPGKLQGDFIEFNEKGDTIKFVTF